MVGASSIGRPHTLRSSSTLRYGSTRRSQLVVRQKGALLAWRACTDVPARSSAPVFHCRSQPYSPLDRVRRFFGKREGAMSENGVTSATSVNGRSVAQYRAVAMSTVPKVWVLLGDKAGGNGQLTSLADALEWPYETKRLRYNLLNHCPNLFLGASILSVDRRQSSPLEAAMAGLGACRFATQCAGGTVD